MHFPQPPPQKYFSAVSLKWISFIWQAEHSVTKWQEVAVQKASTGNIGENSSMEQNTSLATIQVSIFEAFSLYSAANVNDFTFVLVKSAEVTSAIV